MPQPLSTKKHQGYIVRASVFHSKPEHAQLIAQIIATWSVVENTLAGLMPTMLHSNARPVLEMVSRLRSSSALRDIADAAATALPQQLQLPFSASMRVLNRTRKKRNIFAHHLFGEVREYPDCILTIDPVVMQEHHLTYNEWQEAGLGGPPEIERAKMMVWSLSDLLGVLDEVHDALNVIGTLRTAVEQHVMPLEIRANTAPEGDGLRFLMENELVKREIEKLRIAEK